jgi:16S rRNA (uracil1498-N3)-methyltransferase
VNLILFDPAETAVPLPRSDPRAAHILDVLRRKPGETFDAGLMNGPRGKGTLAALDPFTLTLTFTWGAVPPPLDPITLIVGLPRPQTARKILQEVTTLGVSALHFVLTDKGEANYARSTLWSSGEWRRHLIAGAEQAFDTRLPEVTHGRLLAEALESLPDAGSRLALDNYEASEALSQCHVIRDTSKPPAPVVMALGPERGWAARDRDLLRARGFSFVHLGPRVLRMETACIAAVILVKASLGSM